MSLLTVLNAGCVLLTAAVNATLVRGLGQLVLVDLPMRNQLDAQHHCVLRRSRLAAPTELLPLHRLIQQMKPSQ